MKERLWFIKFQYGKSQEQLFGSLRYTDTMLTVFEYDLETYIQYEPGAPNPNKPTRFHYYPLHNVISFEAEAD